VWRRWKHVRHDEAEEEADSDGVDDVAADLAEEEGRGFQEVAVGADGVAMVQAAGDADYVGDEEAGVADCLDIEEGSSGAKGDAA
jgi:hypothetical protein